MSGFAKIAGQLSAGVKLDFPSLHKVRVALGWGFPYESYAPSATVKPWHILNLVESGRALSFNRLPSAPQRPPFLCIQDLYTLHGLFQASAKLLISKQMYDISIPKTPLDLDVELVYVGKSSMNLHTDVTLPSRSLTLASCEVQSVLVDKLTKRPAPHPQWWMDKFGQFTDPKRQLRVTVEKEPLNRNAENMDSLTGDNDGGNSHLGQSSDFQQNDLPISLGVASHDLTVCDSDADAYGHVNWSAFLKYCLDAMVMGSSPEKAGELKRRALKSAEIAYIGEGSVGDKIRVNFWKDASLPGAVHFHIKGCESNKLMTYALLQFYSLQDVELVISKL